MSAGLFGATADEQVGRSSQSSGLGEILRYEVPAGEFRTIPMPKEGGMVHDQVLYAAFWCEEKLPEQPLPEQGVGSSTIKRRQFFLQKDRVNKNRMVIIRQSQQVAWRNEQGGGYDKNTRLRCLTTRGQRVSLEPLELQSIIHKIIANAVLTPVTARKQGGANR